MPRSWTCRRRTWSAASTNWDPEGWRGLPPSACGSPSTVIFSATLHLAPTTLAVLAELMLRGPQTAGELRNRAERMTPLADIASVEEILGALMEFGPPLVTRLPRQTGHKEQRYAQLFAGEPELPADAPAPPPGPARQRVTAGNERLDRLDGEVSTLRTEIAALRRTIEELRALFE